MLHKWDPAGTHAPTDEAVSKSDEEPESLPEELPEELPEDLSSMGASANDNTTVPAAAAATAEKKPAL